MTSPHLTHCPLASKMPIPVFSSKYEPSSSRTESKWVPNHHDRNCHVLITKLPPKLELRLQRQRRIKMHQFIKYCQILLESPLPKNHSLPQVPTKAKRDKKREGSCSSTSKASLGKDSKKHRPILHELLNVAGNKPVQPPVEENKVLADVMPDLNSNIIGDKEVVLTNSNKNERIFPANTSLLSRSVQSSNLPLELCHSASSCNTQFDTDLPPSSHASSPLPEMKLFSGSVKKCSKNHSEKKPMHVKGLLPSPRLSSNKKSKARVGDAKKVQHETTKCHLDNDNLYRTVDCEHNPPSSSVSKTQSYITNVSSTNTYVSQTSATCDKMHGANSKDRQHVHKEKEIKPNSKKDCITSADKEAFSFNNVEIVKRDWLERLKCISKAVQSEKKPSEQKHFTSHTDITTNELQNRHSKIKCHPGENEKCSVSLHYSDSNNFFYRENTQKDDLINEQHAEPISISEQEVVVPFISETILQSPLPSTIDTQGSSGSETSQCVSEPKFSDDAPSTLDELNHRQSKCSPENAQTLCLNSDLQHISNQDSNLASNRHFNELSEQLPNSLQVVSSCSRFEPLSSSFDNAINTVSNSPIHQIQPNSIIPECKKLKVSPSRENESQVDSDAILNIGKDVIIQDPLYDCPGTISSLRSTFEMNEQNFVDVTAISGHSECTMYAPTSQSEDCDVPITPPIDTKDILSRVMTAVFFSDEDEPEEVILSRTAIDSAYRSLATSVDFDQLGGQQPTLMQLQTETSLSPSSASKTFYHGYCIGDGNISIMVQDLLDNIVTNVCHLCDSPSNSFQKKGTDMLLKESALREAMNIVDGTTCTRKDLNIIVSAAAEDSDLNTALEIAEFGAKEASNIHFSSGILHCDRGEAELKPLNNDEDYCDDACSNNTDFVSLKLSSGYDTEEGEMPRPPSRTSSMFHSDLVSDEEGENQFQRQQGMCSSRSRSPLSDIECTVRKVTDDILNWIENGQKEMTYPFEIPLNNFDIQQSFEEGGERLDSTLPLKLSNHLEGNEYTTVYTGDEDYDAGEEDEGFMQMPCIESVYSIQSKDFFIKSPCDEGNESKPVSYDIASPDDNSCWTDQDIDYNDSAIKGSFDNPQQYYSSYNDPGVCHSDNEVPQNVKPSSPNTIKGNTNNEFSKCARRDGAATVNTEGGEKVLDTWAAEMETEQYISKIVTHVMYSILKKCEDAVEMRSSKKRHIPTQVVPKNISSIDDAQSIVPSTEMERNKISLKFSLKRIQEMSNTKHVRKITRRMHRLSLEEEDEEDTKLTGPEGNFAGKDSIRINSTETVFEKDETGCLLEPATSEVMDSKDENVSTEQNPNSPALSLKLSPIDSPRTPSPFYLCHARIDSNHVIKSVNCEENDGNKSEDAASDIKIPKVAAKEKDGLSKYIMSRIHDGKSDNDWKIASVKAPDLTSIDINLLDKMADDVGKEFFFDQDETKSFKESAKIILTTPGKQQSSKKRKKKQKKLSTESKKTRSKKDSDTEAFSAKIAEENHESVLEDVGNNKASDTGKSESSINEFESGRQLMLVEEETMSAGAEYFSEEDEFTTPQATTDGNSDDDGDYSPGMCSVAMQSELVARFLRHKRKDRSSAPVSDHDLDGMLTRMRSLRNRGGNDVVAVDFDNPIPLEYKQSRRKRPTTSASEESAEVSSKPKSSDLENSPRKRRKVFTKTKLKDKFKRKQYKYKQKPSNVPPLFKVSHSKNASDSSAGGKHQRKFFRSRDAYSQAVKHQDAEQSSKLQRDQPHPDAQVIPEAKVVNSGLYDFDEDDVKSLSASPKPMDIHPSKGDVSATLAETVAATNAILPDLIADQCSEDIKGADDEAGLPKSISPVEEDLQIQFNATPTTKPIHFISPPRSPSPEMLVGNAKQASNYEDDDLTDSADEGEGRLLIVVDTDEEDCKEEESAPKPDKDTYKDVPETIPAPETTAVKDTMIISVNQNVLPAATGSNVTVHGSNTTTVSSTSAKPISSVVLPIVTSVSGPINVDTRTSVPLAVQPTVVNSSSNLVSAPSLVSLPAGFPIPTPVTSVPVPMPITTQPDTEKSTLDLAQQIAQACLRASSSAALAGKPVLGAPGVNVTIPSAVTSQPSKISTAAAPVTWPPMQARQSLAGIQGLPNAPDGSKDCTSQYERLKNELLMLEMVALQKERERNNILRLKQYKQNIMHKLQLKKSMMQGGGANPDASALAQQSSPPPVGGRTQNLFKIMMQQAALQAVASNASAIRQQQALLTTASPNSTSQQLPLPFLNPSLLTVPNPPTATTGAPTTSVSLTTTVNSSDSQRLQNSLPSTVAAPPDAAAANVPLHFAPSQVPPTKVVDSATTALMLSEWKKRFKMFTNNADINSSLSSVDTIVAKANENFGLQLQDWLKEATRVYLEQQTHLANLQQSQVGSVPTTHTTSSPPQQGAPILQNLPAGLPNPAAASAADKRQHMSLDDVIRNVYSRRMNLPKPTAVPATAANIGYVPMPVIRGPLQQGPLLPNVYPPMTVTSIPSNTITAPVVRPPVNLPFPNIPMNEQMRPIANPLASPAFQPVNKDLTNASLINNPIYNPPTTSTLAQLLMTPPQDRGEKIQKESKDRNSEVTIISEQRANPVAAPGTSVAQAFTLPADQQVSEAAIASRNWSVRPERKLFPKWPQCQGCKSKLARFICAGCNNQWYCSEPCQVKHWKTHFKTCRSRQ